MDLLLSGFAAVQRPLRSLLRVAIACSAVLLLTFGSPWLSPATATGVNEIPAIGPGEKTGVIDQSDVLSRFNAGQLNSRLDQIREKTGADVHFVLFRRLDYGDTIESFTEKLFDAWFPTEDVQANQVLIAFDTLTNQIALRAGNEVQDRLTAEIGESITQETMMAPIRKGDRYNQSLFDASDRLAAVLAGEADPGPPAVEDGIRVEGTFASAEETQDSNATVIVIILLIVATVVPMVTYFVYVR